MVKDPEGMAKYRKVEDVDISGINIQDLSQRKIIQQITCPNCSHISQIAVSFNVSKLKCSQCGWKVRLFEGGKVTVEF